MLFTEMLCTYYNSQSQTGFLFTSIVADIRIAGSCLLFVGRLRRAGDNGKFVFYLLKTAKRRSNINSCRYFVENRIYLYIIVLL